MSDLIRIVDLEVWPTIGVYDEERAKQQRLLVTVDLRLKDIGPAAYNDNVKMTIDYAEVAERVKLIAKRRPRKLIETLGEEIATDLLRTYPILSLRLEIRKFALPDANHVSLVIERPVPGRDPSAYRPAPTTPLPRVSPPGR